MRIGPACLVLWVGSLILTLSACQAVRPVATAVPQSRVRLAFRPARTVTETDTMGTRPIPHERVHLLEAVVVKITADSITVRPLTYYEGWNQHPVAALPDRRVELARDSTSGVTVRAYSGSGTALVGVVIALLLLAIGISSFSPAPG